jgi:hypothetical protein
MRDATRATKNVATEDTKAAMVVFRRATRPGVGDVMAAVTCI